MGIGIHMDKYAVFGNPIAQSKSPIIHSMFALQTGQQLTYTAELIEKEKFAAESCRQLRKLKGANVTVPFKQEAFELVDMLSRRARQAGAVNTIVKQSDGTLMGDNTDGVGLVNDITRNLAWIISGKRVLILGAGGAVRGALGPILAEEPAELCIANRTQSKAEQLAQAFSGMGNIKSCAFEEIEGTFDLIINGTSASLFGDLPAIPASCIADTTACYDMMYDLEKPTIFNDWVSKNGCTLVSDGFGMLVEQAAEAFELWRGVRPQTAPVIEYFRRGHQG
jgi:shikimate dehydrogenase